MDAASDSEPCKGPCHDCIEKFDIRPSPGYGFRLNAFRMIVCVKCGNKRCPHASDHRLDCTGSNEPDQPGSVY